MYQHIHYFFGENEQAPFSIKKNLNKILFLKCFVHVSCMIRSRINSNKDERVFLFIS
jgi:hypothetical protein